MCQLQMGKAKYKKNNFLLTESCEAWKFLGPNRDQCLQCPIGAHPL